MLRYTHEWQEYVTRQARWVDFEHDYKTLDLDYMESVMWAFKSLWDKGLIYEGYRVLWYCTRCETPLSATISQNQVKNAAYLLEKYRNRLVGMGAVTFGFFLLMSPWM